MTIYGTPYGTPLNATGFQGTQPGNAVQSTLPPISPGVGMFPPNSDTRSNDSVMSAVSRAAMPANANTTNFGTPTSAPGRPILETMGRAGEVGSGLSGLLEDFNGVANGGAGPGAGQVNQTQAPGAGQQAQITGQAPISLVTVPSTPVQYQG